MDEFALINTYFKPLAKNFPGSLNLTDDAAIISIPAGYELIATTDAITSGIHFLGNEDAALIAKKLLRVNLSDLAAMGATPLAYLLAIMLPKNTKSVWLKRFAQGLAEDQKEFGIHLAGGDTIATNGPLTFSITALGLAPKGKALKRNGAKPSDNIYVSGTLGDSALGLPSLRAQRSNPDWIATSASPPRDDDFLINRYLLPNPRLALGQNLLGIASAAMDISDGLVQDLGHICETSNVGATIHRHKLPISQPARALLKSAQPLWSAALSGGDDYELLFTAPAQKALAIARLSKKLKLPLTAIGSITKGKDVQVLDEDGKVLKLKHKGFRHF